MKYPKDYLQEIKTRLKISTVVSKTVSLKKRGKEYVGLSPFKTEKTPSFFKEYNKEVIAKIEKVALASLNYMIEKKEWDHSKVPIIFNEHRKILDTYEKAILDLWEGI